MSQEPKESIKDDLDVSDIEIRDPNMPNFEFELDRYQKTAIYRIKEGQNVFISAPTSAGKTVPAIYAMRHCLSQRKKVFYTSPIKALSNQKFKEFSSYFPKKVGIMTGDIVIRRTASVLIMTTEVLLAMLYKKDPLLSHVGLVIFDEFHYISNHERGGVWEESVIHMPKNIQMIFLSTPMANTKEIADWISKIHGKSVYLIESNSRPIPLNHYVYSNDQFFKISCFEKNTFIESNYRYSRLNPEKNSPNNPKYLLKLVNNLKSNDLLPVLFFEFSIKKIEVSANKLVSKIDTFLVTREETEYIKKFFNNATSKLSPDERKLPQVKTMFYLLTHGIGVHHSGIIPILKEVVEILLSEKKLKVIFCTSTIGMGLNLPVKTTCFLNIEKFNGSEYEYLSLLEYQQMSGRAGRRGIDNNGNSILCMSKKLPDDNYMRSLFNSEPEEIKSQFEINFKMVLNSLKDDEMKIGKILKNSFLDSADMSELRRLIDSKSTEYENYIKMLKDLEYIRETDNHQYKLEFRGEIACDIYGHDIISTEVLFNNVFDDCSPEEIAALCSCLVAQRTGKDKIAEILPEFRQKYERIKNICIDVFNRMKSNSINFEEKNFVKINVNPIAITPVYYWAKQYNFLQITNYSKDLLLEGQLVSIITKVHSMLKCFEEKAQIIDENLFEKIKAAEKLIYKGIIAVQSIYLDESSE